MKGRRAPPDDSRELLPPPTLAPNAPIVHYAQSATGTFVHLPLSFQVNARLIPMRPDERLAFVRDLIRGYDIQVAGCGEAWGPVGADDVCKCGRAM